MGSGALRGLRAVSSIGPQVVRIFMPGWACLVGREGFMGAAGEGRGEAQIEFQQGSVGGSLAKEQERGAGSKEIRGPQRGWWEGWISRHGYGEKGTQEPGDLVSPLHPQLSTWGH